jgi:predicted secreted protein
MNQIMFGGANSRSICADADWPTAPPKLTQKGINIWTTHISASVFLIFLELKFYLMVFISEPEKGTGSFNVIK